jgi:hypothetical protein
MTTEAKIQTNLYTDKDSAKTALTEHIDGLPNGTRKAHTLIGVLIIATMVLVVASFAYALYVSINWKAFELVDIPFWWMVSQACAGLSLILIGLQSMIAKAYWPVEPMIDGSFRADVFSGEKTKFVKGAQAVKWGMVIVGLGLLWTALWVGMYLVAAASSDPLNIFITFVVVVSVGIGVVSIGKSIVKRLRS